ncbi:MAG: CDP-alcohol phosphatidyltransferase family protein [Oscillospiraceae bacterium]
MNINIRDIAKIPNILSLIRVFLVPVFAAVFLRENAGEYDPQTHGGGYTAAAAIVMLSGLTDALDGIIARRFNLITDLGKVLDPFADKLTQAAVALCLAVRYRRVWQVTAVLAALIVVKEITQLVLGVMCLNKGRTLGGAKWFGKLATAVFYVLVIVLLGAADMPDATAAVLFTVMTVMMSVSFALYLREYLLLLWQNDYERHTDI